MELSFKELKNEGQKKKKKSACIILRGFPEGKQIIVPSLLVPFALCHLLSTCL